MNQPNYASNELPSITIGSHLCNREKPALFIAEEGQANQGNLDLAFKMIDIAADCGADGIEFQLGLAADLYVKQHEGFGLYQEREFSAEAIKALVDATHAKGMLFQAACLSEKLIPFTIENSADTLVINATDLNNPRMLDAVAASGLPFFIATLLGTLDEIGWAVDRVRSHGAENFGLLHGQHIMASEQVPGVPASYAQLGCISMLESKYGVPVGFVDHTATEIMPAIAASRGAVMVTKHLSPHVEWKGPDWQVCLEPDAWKRAKDHLSYANSAQGSNKSLSEAENRDRKLMRRSMVAAVEIKAGETIRNENIAFKRPSGGVDPRHFEAYLGRPVIRDLIADEIITENDFEH
jgi:N,N'-diacetyllegionaminate synthase